MNDSLAPAGRFLAVIKYLKPDTPNRFARLKPLYQVDDSGTNWCLQPIRDNDKRFRDEGLIFWWSPSLSAKEGTVWLVTLEMVLGYGRDQKPKDRCRVADARSPFQAVALQGITGPRAFRRMLAGGSLSFEGRLVGRALVSMPNEAGRWLALPEGLVSLIDQHTSSVTAHGLEGVLPVYSIEPDAFAQVLIGNHRYSLLPPDLGTPHGYQCVLTDTQLAEHMRKRISKLDRQTLKAIGITKNLLQHYVETIKAADLGGDEAAKEEARRDAAKTLIEGIETESSQVEAIVDILMQHPRVTELLDTRINAALRMAQEHWEQETAKARVESTQELTRIRRDIKIATGELETLRSNINVALQDILDAPVEVLVRHGLSDALLHSLPSLIMRSTVSEPSTQQIPDVSVPSICAVESISDIAHLKTVVQSWAFETGVDLYMLHVALAAVLAHRITLVSGANAERLAAALASSLAGDNAVRVSLGTAVFSLADVMGTAVTAIGSTRLDGSFTLGRFLAKQDPEAIVVVLFSGCNRAPLEVVLPDLLPLVGDVPTTLAWSTVDGSVTTMTLPLRVRFIGTLHDGTATYLVPSEIGKQVGLVPADHREMQGIDPPETPAPRPTRVAKSLFDTLQITSGDEAIAALVKKLWKNNSALPRPTLTRLVSTYLAFLSDPVRAPAEAIASLLLSRVHAPTFTDIPGEKGEAIREHLNRLMDSPAWQAARRHFDRGDPL